MSHDFLYLGGGLAADHERPTTHGESAYRSGFNESDAAAFERLRVRERRISTPNSCLVLPSEIAACSL